MFAEIYLLKGCVWSPWNLLKCDIASAKSSAPSALHCSGNRFIERGISSPNDRISYTHACSKIYQIDNSMYIYSHVILFSGKVSKLACTRHYITDFFPCSMLSAQSRICAILKSTRNVSSNIWRKTRNKYMYRMCVGMDGWCTEKCCFRSSHELILLVT